MTRATPALQRLTAFALAVAFALNAPATTYTWDAGGTTDHKWSTGANWNPDGVPTFDANADLVFGPTYEPATGNSTLLLDGNRVVRSLSFNWGRANNLTLSGGTLTLRDVNRTTNTVGNAKIVFYASNQSGGNHGTVTLSGNSLWDHKASGNGVQIELYATLGDGGAGYSFTQTGSGAIFLYDNASYGGNTVIRGGTLRTQANTATDCGRITASPRILVTDGGTLAVKPWSYLTGNMLNDSADILLYGGTYFFHDGQNLDANSAPETNAVLRVGQGQNILQGTGRNGYTCGMRSSSLQFADGAILWFQPPTGTATGIVRFATAPAQVGSGGGDGSFSRSILRATAVGNSVTTVSLVTYDTARGLVPLNRATEFATSIAGVGANTDYNVRRSSAETLTADRTVNGLVLDFTTAGSIGGAFNLTVAGGTIASFSTATPTLGTSQLRFGGGPGCILFANAMTVSASIADTTDFVIAPINANFTDPPKSYTLTLSGAGAWSGRTFVNGRSGSIGVLSTGNNSERLPDTTVVHLGGVARLEVGNATETIAGLAGTGEAKLISASGKLLVGSGTATANRFVVGGGATQGTLAPGLADNAFQTGKLTLTPQSTAGGVTLGAKAVVNLELAGLRAVTFDFDVLNVSLGDIVLGGTLNVTTLNGFTPAKNDSWVVMTAEKKAAATVSGSFAAVTKGYTAEKVDTNADSYNDAVKLTFVGLPAGGTVVMIR